MRTVILLTAWIVMATPCWGFQDKTPASGEEPDIQVSESMTVKYLPEDFRYRSDSMAPTLIYGKEFFQRFEPLSVGDILQRIPGISGSADAGEFDKPQLRGIGPQYTQILINGERLPGAGNDRTLAVDRIPAHLVERIEIMRSPDADTDAQGIGGTINIVLKDGRGPGGFDVLTGFMHFEPDGKNRGQTAVTYSESRDRVSFAVTGSVQKRHNPKDQFTIITDADDERVFKDEDNILDATETAINASLRINLPGDSILTARAVTLASDRDEREDVIFSSDGEVEEQAFERMTATQDNWGGQIAFERPHAGLGMLYFSISHQSAELDSRLNIGVLEEGEMMLQEFETDNTTDRETKLRSWLSIGKFEKHLIKTGFDLGLKKRDAGFRFFEIEEDEIEEVELGGVFGIEEQRIDFYLMDTWSINDKHALQTGIRFERTELELRDANRIIETDEFYPSLHYLFKPISYAQFRLGYARTVKRPDFMDLQPFLQRDTPFEDRNTLGNPELRPEFADGLDVGYEHRFKRHEGILGVNFFVRDITDRVEVVQLNEEDFQFRNVGDGQLYGVELDIGLPLSALRLPNMSFFANLTLQDSELTDPLTGQKRPFNFQADSVFNLSLLHTFPELGFSYGVNWLTQGKSIEIFLTETSEIENGDNLEFLLEKQWKRQWSIRFMARNLLDAEKIVRLNEYEGLWTDGELSETSFETEFSGRSYFLTLRGLFGRNP